MKIDTVTAAIQEAERFLQRARRAVAEHKAEAMLATNARPPDNTYLLAGPRETGALRRASMDLTRALADLRRAS